MDVRASITFLSLAFVEIKSTSIFRRRRWIPGSRRCRHNVGLHYARRVQQPPNEDVGFWITFLSVAVNAAYRCRAITTSGLRSAMMICSLYDNCVSNPKGGILRQRSWFPLVTWSPFHLSFVSNSYCSKVQTVHDHICAGENMSERMVWWKFLCLCPQDG